jgi:hypothetical protein
MLAYGGLKVARAARLREFPAWTLALVGRLMPVTG